MAAPRQGRPVLLDYSSGTIKTLEVRALPEGGFAIIEGARWRDVGTLYQGYVRGENGYSLKRWIARNPLGEETAADSQERAAVALIEALSWYRVHDVDTIPGLF